MTEKTGSIEGPHQQDQGLLCAIHSHPDIPEMNNSTFHIIVGQGCYSYSAYISVAIYPDHTQHNIKESNAKVRSK